MKKLSVGFTMIEVLVVIGVLLVFVLMLPAGIQYAFQKGRDTNRKSDIHQYQIALETYANDNGSIYPLSDGTISAASVLCPQLSGYLDKCNEDPSYTKDPTFTYSYQSSASRTKYVLWAKEDKGSKYWVVCSNKLSGEVLTTGFSVTDGACPVTLTQTSTPTASPTSAPTAVPTATPTPTQNANCVTYYRDSDGDGYGNPNSSQVSCTGAPSGYVANSTDCYDSNSNAKPGQTSYFATNRGDGSFDYNCDGTASAQPITYYNFPDSTACVPVRCNAGGTPPSNCEEGGVSPNVSGYITNSNTCGVFRHTGYTQAGWCDEGMKASIITSGAAVACR